MPQLDIVSYWTHRRVLDGRVDELRDLLATAKRFVAERERQLAEAEKDRAAFVSENKATLDGHLAESALRNHASKPTTTEG